MKKSLIITGTHILEVDMSKSYDLSIPVRRKNPVNAYGLPDPSYNVYKTRGFVGSVREGGTVNCEEIYLLPHGNGTHTECVGHISAEPVWIKSCLKEYLFSALVITVEPEVDDEIKTITRGILEASILPWYYPVQALIVRSLPDNPSRFSKRFAGTNPPFFTNNAIKLMNEMEIEHLITDLPSIDEENDAELTAHHTFWQYPENTMRGKTITELAYIPGAVEDGYYLLNLHIPSLETDAVPSRPVIFPAERKK